MHGLSLVVTSRGHTPVVLHRLLIEVASSVAERGLQSARASEAVAGNLSSCSSPALEHGLSSRGLWA